MVHVALALGSVLMSFAVFDFRTAKWIAWVGCVSSGALAGIFLLQGVSELIQNASLTYLVYRVLGQRIEAWLVDLFLLWCIAVLLIDSQGKTRMLGFIAVSIAVGVAFATSRGVEAPSLKVLSLLPFAWLLLESKKTSPLLCPTP